jgi:outer membrane protein W
LTQSVKEKRPASWTKKETKMKTIKTNKQKIKALFITMAMVASPAVVFAQDDDLLAGTDDVLNSEQIDIDGSYDRRESGSDRIAKLRKRLESQNEEMMAKKIENERIKAEKKLEIKLRRAFTGGNSDRVVVRQAAPQRIAAPAPIVAVKSIKRTSVIPSIGVSQALRDTDNAESKIDLGLNIEHAVHENVSVGLGLGFSKIQFETDNNNFFFASQPTNEENEYDYEYSRMNINLNAKFYFTGLDNKFRPYFGAGLGYNRVTISDTNPTDDNFSNNGSSGGYQYQNPDQDTEITDSVVSATANLGSNLLFNDIVGMNINFSYTRFITSAFNSSNENNGNNQFNANENALRDQGKSVSEDSVMGVSVGVVINF